MNLKWDPKYLGWKYFNYVIVVLGLIVGIGAWFMPNKWADPAIEAKIAEQNELKEMRRVRLAREAEEKRLVDELGLIYITPEANPFKPLPADPKKDVPKKN